MPKFLSSWVRLLVPYPTSIFKDEVTIVTLKLPLFLNKHHATKAYREVEI